MQPTTDQRQYRPDNLSWLTGELREIVQFVDDPDVKSRIYQFLRDTSEKRRAYRRYAEDVGCHQITAALSEHVEQYQALQERGLDLLEESDTAIGFTDETNEGARVEAEAAQEGR